MHRNLRTRPHWTGWCGEIKWKQVPANKRKRLRSCQTIKKNHFVSSHRLRMILCRKNSSDWDDDYIWIPHWHQLPGSTVHVTIIFNSVLWNWLEWITWGESRQWSCPGPSEDLDSCVFHRGWTWSWLIKLRIKMSNKANQNVTSKEHSQNSLRSRITSWFPELSATSHETTTRGWSHWKWVFLRVLFGQTKLNMYLTCHVTSFHDHHTSYSVHSIWPDHHLSRNWLRIFQLLPSSKSTLKSLKITQSLLVNAGPVTLKSRNNVTFW